MCFQQAKKTQIITVHRSVSGVNCLQDLLRLVLSTKLRWSEEASFPNPGMRNRSAWFEA